MKESKDHINIDLEFLDKKESLRVPPKIDPHTGQTSDTASSVSTGKKYKWRNLFFAGGIIVFIGWIMSTADSGNTPSTSTSTPSSSSSYTPPTTTSGDTVRNGQYSCSKYNSDQADLLDATESEQQLNQAQNLVQQSSDELDRLKNEIDSSYVNNSSSQYEIDNYNGEVNMYNSKLASYKRDASNMSSRIDKYNAQIEKRNNYLIAHCTKAY